MSPSHPFLLLLPALPMPVPLYGSKSTGPLTRMWAYKFFYTIFEKRHTIVVLFLIWLLESLSFSFVLKPQMAEEKALPLEAWILSFTG